jgi:DNA-binding response OmpR family regulator
VWPGLPTKSHIAAVSKYGFQSADRNRLHSDEFALMNGPTMLSAGCVKMENSATQPDWYRSGSASAPLFELQSRECRGPLQKDMTRILVVEDQRSLLRNLIRGLEEEGYEVIPAASVGDAREGLTRQPDVLVLDVMLPDGSGVDFLRQLRGEGFRQPILVLTARDSVDDRVQGLDAGADDYLVKPFSFNELLARLRALLRRGSLEQQAILRVEGLEIDRLNRVATRNGLVLDLSNRQFELLSYLMQHANAIVNREMIARDVWREATATWTNVIEVHIAQLRRKIERPDWPQLLHTVRGQGYVLGKSP